MSYKCKFCHCQIILMLGLIIMKAVVPQQRVENYLFLSNASLLLCADFSRRRTTGLSHVGRYWVLWSSCIWVVASPRLWNTLCTHRTRGSSATDCHPLCPRRQYQLSQGACHQKNRIPRFFKYRYQIINVHPFDILNRRFFSFACGV